MSWEELDVDVAMSESLAKSRPNDLRDGYTGCCLLLQSKQSLPGKIARKCTKMSVRRENFIQAL